MRDYSTRNPQMLWKSNDLIDMSQAITAGLYYAPSICWFWGEDKAKALGSTAHSDGIINLERIFNQSAQRPSRCLRYQEMCWIKFNGVQSSETEALSYAMPRVLSLIKEAIDRSVIPNHFGVFVQSGMYTL